MTESKWFTPTLLTTGAAGSVIAFLTNYPLVAAFVVLGCVVTFIGDRIVRYYQAIIEQQNALYQSIFDEHKRQCDTLVARYEKLASIAESKIEQAELKAAIENELKHLWISRAHAGEMAIAMNDTVLEMIKPLITAPVIIETIDARLKSNQFIIDLIENTKTKAEKRESDIQVIDIK